MKYGFAVGLGLLFGFLCWDHLHRAWLDESRMVSVALIVGIGIFSASLSVYRFVDLMDERWKHEAAIRKRTAERLANVRRQFLRPTTI